jgi:predicted porin
MNRNLLLAALGAALAGGAGYASAGPVTLYGNVNVSIDSIDIDGGGDDINMESNTSALGVKGSEDLGNNLKAIFQAEFQFDADDGGSLEGRDQWVGLSGNNWGKLRLGTISTSYKSHGAMIDPLYRTSLQGRGRSGTTKAGANIGSTSAFTGGMQSGLHRGKGNDAQGRLTNHVRYDSPSWSGFGFTIDYALDDNDAQDGDDTYGGGVQYKNGGILVFADYITTDSSTPDIYGDGTDTGDDAWKIGGSFMWGGFGFYGQYEAGGLVDQQSSTLVSPSKAVTVGNDDATLWHLAASYTIGNTLLYLGYGHGEDFQAKSNDYEHDAWTIALDHRLSKRTDAYVGWNQTDVDSDGAGAIDGETDLFSLGLRHKF